MTPEEILKLIGYDNDSITSTEKWIAEKLFNLLSKEIERLKEFEIGTDEIKRDNIRVYEENTTLKLEIERLRTSQFPSQGLREEENLEPISISMAKENDCVLEAVDFYWRHCIEQLERKDLGDIERKNYEVLKRKLSFVLSKNLTSTPDGSQGLREALLEIKEMLKAENFDVKKIYSIATEALKKEPDFKVIGTVNQFGESKVEIIPNKDKP